MRIDLEERLQFVFGKEQIFMDAKIESTYKTIQTIKQYIYVSSSKDCVLRKWDILATYFPASYGSK